MITPWIAGIQDLRIALMHIEGEAGLLAGRATALETQNREMLQALRTAERALDRSIDADLEAPILIDCARIWGRDGNPTNCTCGFCARMDALAEVTAAIAKATAA